jgi:hypothetical protein
MSRRLLNRCCELVAEGIEGLDKVPNLVGPLNWNRIRPCAKAHSVDMSEDVVQRAEEQPPPEDVKDADESENGQERMRQVQQCQVSEKTALLSSRAAIIEPWSPPCVIAASWPFTKAAMWR